MKLSVLSEAQIKALPLTDKVRKSNEAFAKLASLIKYYNDGWQPTKDDLGYLVYSKRLLFLWGGYSMDGTTGNLGCAYSDGAFTGSSAYFGVRLAIKDYDLARFMIEHYEHLYRELWMED